MNEDIINTQTEEKSESKKRRFPLFAIIFLALGGLSALLYLLFVLSADFSDFFNRYISSAVRVVLAHATGWIPFSFAEYLLLLSPLLIVGAAVYGVKKYADTWRDVFIFCGSLLSVISLCLSLFVIGFAPAYRGKTLDEKLGIDRSDVSAEELYDTALILAGKVNGERLNVIYDSATDFSVMPYGLDEMNDKLIDAYGDICDGYSFVQRLDSNIKPVMLSELMSYTHITGVYSFFTGEANINVSFPDYTIPFTAAHELAHQRGIAREDEANFMAFLVCSSSEDSYIRYSAYLNLFEYVSSALYSASPELYYNAIAQIDGQVRSEMRAYSRFFDKYRDSTASKVSETVNNTSLIIQGTEGTKSYGMVVDLAVAFYRSDKAPDQ